MTAAQCALAVFTKLADMEGNEPTQQLAALIEALLLHGEAQGQDLEEIMLCALASFKDRIH